MKTVIITLLLLFQTLYAEKKVLHVRYDISYAIFGTIGVSDATLTIDPEKKQYTIQIKAHAKGLAKLMSNGRVELYESHGVIKKGILIPQRYETLTKKGRHFEELHRYRFDHKARKIFHKHQIKTADNTQMTEEVLPYYARDDIQTLFFNLKKYVQSGVCHKNGCTLRAVGANDKEGRVDIVPAKKNMLKVILHRRIFASKRGEIYIHLTKEGFSDYAMLKDVVFFGDVKAKAIKIEHR